MALYCVACNYIVVDDSGTLLSSKCYCKEIVSLGCNTCGGRTAANATYCPACAGRKTVPNIPTIVDLSPVPAPNLPSLNLPALPPGLDLRSVVVPPSYDAGKFGASAVVTMNGRDAEILTKMGQCAMVLHAMAKEMNELQGIGDSTRRLIKGCRNLATDLLEEVEVRKGPQG